jgi:hypothetical protein
MVVLVRLTRLGLNCVICSPTLVCQGAKKNREGRAKLREIPFQSYVCSSVIEEAEFFFQYLGYFFGNIFDFGFGSEAFGRF